MTKLDPCFKGLAGAQAVEKQLVPIGAEFPVFTELLEWAETAPYTTTPQLFLHAYTKSKDRPFLGKRVGDHFEFETYEEVYGKIRRVLIVNGILRLELRRLIFLQLTHLHQHHRL